MTVSKDVTELLSRLTQSEQHDLLESLRARYAQERQAFWQLIEGYKPTKEDK
jgi:hypothetical protein